MFSSVAMRIWFWPLQACFLLLSWIHLKFETYPCSDSSVHCVDCRRSLPFSSPAVWKSLPLSICSTSTLSTFPSKPSNLWLSDNTTRGKQTNGGQLVKSIASDQTLAPHAQVKLSGDNEHRHCFVAWWLMTDAENCAPRAWKGLGKKNLHVS